MHFTRRQPLFDSLHDAGRQLATQLDEYQGQSVVVPAIPNGGVPIGLEVALSLEADLDLGHFPIIIPASEYTRIRWPK